MDNQYRLGDPVYVYTNAPAIDPQVMRGQNENAIAYYKRRMVDDPKAFGSQENFSRIWRLICDFAIEAIQRWETPEEKRRFEEWFQAMKREVEEGAKKRQAEEEKPDIPPTN